MEQVICDFTKKKPWQVNSDISLASWLLRKICSWGKPTFPNHLNPLCSGRCMTQINYLLGQETMKENKSGLQPIKTFIQSTVKKKIKGKLKGGGVKRGRIGEEKVSWN